MPASPGFFVGGTRPYVEPGGDEGEAGVPQDEDGESVGQADYLFLLAGKGFGGGIARFDSRGGLRGRSVVPRKMVMRAPVRRYFNGCMAAPWSVSEYPAGVRVRKVGKRKSVFFYNKIVESGKQAGCRRLFFSFAGRRVAEPWNLRHNMHG